MSVFRGQTQIGNVKESGVSMPSRDKHDNSQWFAGKGPLNVQGFPRVKISVIGEKGKKR